MIRAKRLSSICDRSAILCQKRPEELMEKRSPGDKIIDAKCPRSSGKLARPALWHQGKFRPRTAGRHDTAYYNRNHPMSALPASIDVNTVRNSEPRPFWEFLSRERFYRHHQQIRACSRNSTGRNFRNIGAFIPSPLSKAGVFYSERLGIEMDLYGTPRQGNMGGFLGICAGCRLVVRRRHPQQRLSRAAVRCDFNDRHTALSTANIEAEVNRYISLVRSALAIKLAS